MENARQSAAAGPDGEMPPDAPSPEEAAKAEAAYRAQAREAYEAAAAVLGRKLESMAGKGKAVATDEQTELEELLAEVRRSRRRTPLQTLRRHRQTPRVHMAAARLVAGLAPHACHPGPGPLLRPATTAARGTRDERRFRRARALLGGRRTRDECLRAPPLVWQVRSKVAEHSDEPSGASSSAAAPAAEGVTTIGFGAPAA
eukprot:1389877-Prymnesium_polylepis.1